MPLPELVHNKVKEWIQENGPIKCEGDKDTKLMEDDKITFEESNYHLSKILRNCLTNLLQQHREVIIKGDRKGELPGIHPDKQGEREKWIREVEGLQEEEVESE
jgi:hypothetical protein